MHQYSTDVSRWRIIAGIGGIAVLCTIIINPILERVLPTQILSLTVLTLASIFYYLYRFLLWLPVGRLLDSQIPNLNGEWELTEDSGGTLSRESESNGGTKKLVIEQDWTRIQIDYYDEHRVYLRSNSAKMSTLGTNNPELTFTCEGEIPEEGGQSYRNIEGTFRLRFVQSPKGERLVGRYYDNLKGSSSSMVEFNRNSDKTFRWRPPNQEKDTPSEDSTSPQETTGG